MGDEERERVIKRNMDKTRGVNELKKAGTNVGSRTEHMNGEGQKGKGRLTCTDGGEQHNKGKEPRAGTGLPGGKQTEREEGEGTGKWVVRHRW